MTPPSSASISEYCACPVGDRAESLVSARRAGPVRRGPRPRSGPCGRRRICPTPSRTARCSARRAVVERHLPAGERRRVRAPSSTCARATACVAARRAKAPRATLSGSRPPRGLRRRSSRALRGPRTCTRPRRAAPDAACAPICRVGVLDHRRSPLCSPSE